MKRAVPVAILAVVVAAAWLWGHHVGAAGVTGEWNADKARQAQAAATQTEKASNTEKTQSAAFAGIETNYIRDSPYASAIASSTADAVSDGTLRVRFCAAESRSSGHPVSAAATGSRVADAAATQALADSVQAAISALRVGDEADAREQQLRQQVIALQAVIKAERAKQ